MYKYEKIGEAIVGYLDQCKNEGADAITISALEVEHKFDVSALCGAEKSKRYPMICQAMEYVHSKKYNGEIHAGPNPSSTFTITYYLRGPK